MKRYIRKMLGPKTINAQQCHVGDFFREAYQLNRPKELVEPQAIKQGMMQELLTGKTRLI